MKKYIVLALLFVPVVAFSAPSVRVLGNNSNNTNTVTKAATPAKSAATSGSVSGSRIGTVRAKPASAVSTSKSGASTNADTRFPVALVSPKYQAIEKPKPAGSTTVVNTEINKQEIVEEVINQMGDNYYNKTEVYNKNEVYNNQNFENAVKDVDDPRIDAIKIGVPHHDEDLPKDYVYMWIEK